LNWQVVTLIAIIFKRRQELKASKTSYGPHKNTQKMSGKGRMMLYMPPFLFSLGSCYCLFTEAIYWARWASQLAPISRLHIKWLSIFPPMLVHMIQ